MTPAKTNSIKNEAYGVRLQSMEDVPPTIGEIQLLPPWVRPWVLRQLVQWILEHNGDTSAAIKAAARSLGLEHKRSGPRAPEPPPVGDLPPAPTEPEAGGEPGSSDNGGAGEGLSLKGLLRRYALIEGTTHVWDIDKAKKMKRAAFEAHVGKEKFKEWSAVTDSTKKRVSEEWVRDIEQAACGLHLGCRGFQPAAAGRDVQSWPLIGPDPKRQY